MRTYAGYARDAEDALKGILKAYTDVPEKLLAAMDYSLNAGGKRLRPVMLLAASDMCGGDYDTAMPFACALEMIHTYSLIHDDLPAMDNDDLRRGRPTNHKVFGDAMAILAGDGLLNTAAQLMAETAARMDDTRGARAMAAVMRRSGITGMIAGQVLDITLEGAAPTESSVRAIHLHKTADLLTAPMEAGMILAGADDDTVRAGAEYAKHLGLAFQMIDDLLDVTGDAVLLGKNPGSDAAKGKQTWVSLRGPEKTAEDAAREAESAVKAIECINADTEFFVSLARELTRRTS